MAAPLAGVAVVAVGAGVWALLLRPSSAASSAARYRAVPVTTGTIRQTVSATGTIGAADTEELNFPAAGKVTSVAVTVGQRVVKGQALAAIDSATLRSAVAAAQASLATAQARLASDQSASASSEQIASDQANIAVAQTQLSQAQSELSGATLTAPIAGTVTAVNVVAGQQVAGGSSGSNGSNGSSSGSQGGTGQGGSSAGSGGGSGGGAGGSGSSGSSSSGSSSSSSAAIEIVSTGSYVVNASVDSSDVSLIQKNDQVVIVPSTSSRTVFGLVSSIGVVATSSSGVASFPVVVAVTGSPSGLYIGATADLQIVYRQLTDVLVVPTVAVDRSGGTTTVLVQSGGTQTRRTVVTGASSGGVTQIVSGLREGELVMVAQVSGGRGTGGTGTGGSGRTQNGGNQGESGGSGGSGGFQGGGGPPGGARGTGGTGGAGDGGFGKPIG